MQDKVAWWPSQGHHLAKACHVDEMQARKSKIPRLVITLMRTPIVLRGRPRSVAPNSGRLANQTRAGMAQPKRRAGAR